MSGRESVPGERITLHDGRRLGFLVCGAATGRTVFYCHGFPGSRLEVRLAERTALEKRIRIVGVDRPGYGLSDPRPGRRLMDWADDLRELADRLNCNRFSVLGVSGGGPYAAACAYKLAGRIVSAGLVCGLAPRAASCGLFGMSPVNQFGLRLSSTAPWLLKPAFLPLTALLRHLPQLVLAILCYRAVPPDRSALNRGEIRRMLLRTFREAMRSGCSGAVEDLHIYGRPWGFSPREIIVPVYIWHGEKDRIVPPAMGRWMAANIPGSHAAFCPHEGHFSLIANQMNRILSRLAA